MKILIVARFKENGYAPFVTEQAAALEKAGVKCVFFPMRSKGVRGYARQLPVLREVIRKEKPGVIHAHYGFCGLFSNLQRKVPVVTTYHGSDINNPSAFRLSRISMRLSAWNIFVSRKTMEIAHPGKHYSLLPCGIDLTELQLTGKSEARQRMHLDDSKHYVLFAGAFDNAVKNASLAKEAVTLLNDTKVELLELKDYSREEVTLLMCAADAFLMTSVSEGSPQVIKEAMACGCPIVSVDVGDVKERINGLEGCLVSESNEPQELAGLLMKAFAFGRKTEGRVKVISDGLDNESIASRLIQIYTGITSQMVS